MKYLRQIGLVVLFCTLSGCGSQRERFAVLPNLLPSQQEATATAPAQVDIPALKEAMTPALLAQAGGELLIAQLPARGLVATMPRVARNDDVVSFLSPDGISISMRDGLIVATRGFGFDLMASDLSSVATTLERRDASSTRVHRYLDGEDQVVTWRFDCRYSYLSRESATEDCTSPFYAFQNSYTLAQSGKILSARQWVSPRIGYVLTEVLR